LIAITQHDKYVIEILYFWWQFYDFYIVSTIRYFHWCFIEGERRLWH